MNTSRTAESFTERSSTSSTAQEDLRLKKGVIVSIALHVFVIAVFTIQAVFFNQAPIDFTQAIRVDMIALPDKIAPADLSAPPTKENPKADLPQKKDEPKEEPLVDKKPPAPKETAKTGESSKKPPQSDAVNLEKVKAKQQSAIDKLKAMAALERIKEDVSNEQVKAPIGTGKDKQGQVPVKGNTVSAGNSLTGLAKLEHETYGSDLDRHIKQHWFLPEFLAKRDYKAQIRVLIDGRGNILDRKIIKSSGNPDYDDAVVATIDKSAPFPAPPERLSVVVAVDGIVIGFPE